VALAKVLLAHSANPNLRDGKGKTPLHVAAEDGSREVARVLLAHGAKTSIADERGKTPIEAASDGYSDYCWEVSELFVANRAARISLRCGGCGATYVPGQDAISMTSGELMGMMPGLIGRIPSGLMIGRAKSPNQEQLRRDLVTIMSLAPKSGWTCQCNTKNTWQASVRRRAGATRPWWRFW
jgi:ankyrin repeat protein